MDRVRKELRMMVMDADKGLPYSKHCIPCGCSFKTIPILTRKLVFKGLNFAMRSRWTGSRRSP